MGGTALKLTKEQESLLKFVPSVEVRKMIRSRIKTLLNDIQKTYKLKDNFGWQMEKTRGKARREINLIEQQLINNYSIQQSKKGTKLMKTVQLSNKRIKEDLLYLYREYEQNIISRQEIIDYVRDIYFLDISGKKYEDWYD